MPRFPGFFTQGRTVITVAASNTPQRFREGADFVCSGSSDQTVINAAIVQAGTEGLPGNPGSQVLLLPGGFTISGSILMNRTRVSLIGCGNGTGSQGTEITGTSLGSTTPAILVSATTVHIEGFGLSSGGYGIEYSSSTNWMLKECYIHNCGNYGVYAHGGIWTCVIDHCRITNNTNAEIYCVTPNSGEQNGNNFRITNSRIGGLATKGIVWNAASLYCAGNDIEGSGNIGLAIGENTTFGPQGATIIGNYFEGWNVALIRLGDSGASSTSHNAAGVNTAGVFISGNYINKAGATVGIQLSQVYGSLIGGNHITTGGTGRSIQSINVSENTVILPIVDENATSRSTISSALKIGEWHSSSTSHLRKTPLNGDLFMKGNIPWTAGNPNSDNITGNVTAYFYIPMAKEGDMIRNIEFRYALTDSARANETTGDTVSLKLQKSEAGTSGSTATWTDVQTKTLNGNIAEGVKLTATNFSERIDGRYHYRLRVQITPVNANGTAQFYNPAVTFITE